MARRTQKLYVSLTIVITLCLQLCCSLSSATEPRPPAERISSADLASALTEAGSLFREREDISKLRDAISVLAGVRDPAKRSFETEWKFAKYNYFLGKRTTDEKEAEAAFTAGRDAAKIARWMETEKADGYFWYAANLAELGRLNPLTIGVSSIGDIKASMNKVIEIDPAYQHSSAYDGLAQIEMGTLAIGGSAEKAAETLETALRTETRNSNLHLHLAEAYLALKRAGDARKQLDLLMQMKPDPEYLPEYADSREKAKKMLAARF